MESASPPPWVFNAFCFCLISLIRPLLKPFSVGSIFLVFLDCLAASCCLRKSWVSALIYLILAYILLSSSCHMSLSFFHISACLFMSSLSSFSLNFLSYSCYSRVLMIYCLSFSAFLAFNSSSLLIFISLCLSYLAIISSSFFWILSSSLRTPSAILFMKSCALFSLAAISLSLSCSYWSSILA